MSGSGQKNHTYLYQLNKNGGDDRNMDGIPDIEQDVIQGYTGNTLKLELDKFNPDDAVSLLLIDLTHDTLVMSKHLSGILDETNLDLTVYIRDLQLDLENNKYAMVISERYYLDNNASDETTITGHIDGDEIGQINDITIQPADLVTFGNGDIIEPERTNEFRTFTFNVNAGEELELPLSKIGIYNCIVDWGDDSTEEYIQAYPDNVPPLSHTYQNTGAMSIKITGTFNGINARNNKKLISITGDPIRIRGADTFMGCSKLTILDKPMSDPQIPIVSMYAMFDTCSSLTSLDLSNLDTSRVESMYSMFYSCTGLESLDLSNFDTSKVESMKYMFYRCTDLTTLNGLSNFDTSRVESMYSMFYSCTGLESLDLSNFDTSRVESMKDMFYWCKGLTTLNGLSNFDTSRVESMKFMFSTCTGLESLDLSNFDTSKVESMEHMFSGCRGLKSLTGLSNFDTSKVESMDSMFSGCSGLESLNLSNFDTSKVENMDHMLFGCAGLTSLDLSNFDTSKVESMDGMLYYCRGLKSLDLSNFDTSKVEIMKDMFSGCISLRTLDLGELNTGSLRFSQTIGGVLPDLKILDISGHIYNSMVAIDNIVSQHARMLAFGTDFTSATLQKTPYTRSGSGYGTQVADLDFHFTLYSGTESGFIYGPYIENSKFFLDDDNTIQDQEVYPPIASYNGTDKHWFFFLESNEKLNITQNGNAVELARWIQMGQDIDSEAMGDWSGYSVSMSADGNRVAIGAPQNNGNDSNSGHVRVYEYLIDTWHQMGEDIDGEAGNDRSGQSVSMSADGNRVAIGAALNDGNDLSSGHVRIYSFNGTKWEQMGEDIDGEAVGDLSGQSVSMSTDGNRVAIGAKYNYGNGSISGHVRVYSFNGTKWEQMGQDIDGEAIGDLSGQSVSMSADGNRVAIGAPENDGNGSNSGHVRIYSFNGTSWEQVSEDIDSEAGNDRSGYSVSMSAGGNRVAIGAHLNDGNGTNSGYVRVYELN